MKYCSLLLAAVCSQAYTGWQNNNGVPVCSTSACNNVDHPCLDNDNGECYARTDPTYNVTSGQCRAGTTDCCCTSGCCCPPSLPCQQQNDYKCMPKIQASGQYCKFDEAAGAYPAECVCSAGTITCDEDPRTCHTSPPTPRPPTPRPPTPRPPTPRPTPAGTPAPTPCKKPLDVLFLVDSSGSIGDTNYKIMGKAMGEIVDGLQVGPAEVHVAAWTFADGHGRDHDGFGFTKYLTTHSVAANIQSLRYFHGSTHTGDAISWTLMSQWPTARSTVQHAMIILTDGKPQDSVAAPAAAARALGIKVFSVGVGGTYNMASLRSMASQPYSDYVYGLKNFDVAQIKAKLIDIACRPSVEEDTEIRPAEPLNSTAANLELDAVGASASACTNDSPPANAKLTCQQMALASSNFCVEEWMLGYCCKDCASRRN